MQGVEHTGLVGQESDVQRIQLRRLLVTSESLFEFLLFIQHVSPLLLLLCLRGQIPMFIVSKEKVSYLSLNVVGHG